MFTILNAVMLKVRIASEESALTELTDHRSPVGPVR